MTPPSSALRLHAVLPQSVTSPLLPIGMTSSPFSTAAPLAGPELRRLEIRVEGIRKHMLAKMEVCSIGSAVPGQLDVMVDWNSSHLPADTLAFPALFRIPVMESLWDTYLSTVIAAAGVHACNTIPWLAGGNWGRLQLTLQDLDSDDNRHRLTVSIDRATSTAQLRSQSPRRCDGELAVPEEYRHRNASAVLVEMSSRLILSSPDFDGRLARLPMHPS